VTIGLMGFGRIGRNVFRQIGGDENTPVAAITDIADPEATAYLLKYDSHHGPFPEPLSPQDGNRVAASPRLPPLVGAAPDSEDAPIDASNVFVTLGHVILLKCSRTAAWRSE